MQNKAATYQREYHFEGGIINIFVQHMAILFEY